MSRLTETTSVTITNLTDLIPGEYTISLAIDNNCYNHSDSTKNRSIAAGKEVVENYLIECGAAIKLAAAFGVEMTNSFEYGP
ncbi:MAG: hypothetical protein ACFCU6_11740, partial [Balneolaceae bacterium]